MDNKSSVHFSMLFENNWLAWYPCPSHCVHDHGGEFTGVSFPICHMLTELKTLLPQEKYTG